MTTWFKRVAVFAAWLGLATVGLAQNIYPTRVGATRIPEPINYTPDQPPPTNFVPGPVNPLMAPAGPPESLNLPANHTSAFMLDNYPPESKWFFSAGWMALQRSGLDSMGIVFADNQNNAVDTGNTPIGNLPLVFPLNQLRPGMSNGVRATIGYLFANEAFELTGFYIPEDSVNDQVADRGRLFVPFVPGNAFPLGFEGNNNIWRQADLVSVRYTGTLANAEANYRWWNSGLNECEFLAGVRYFHHGESVNIFTDDEFFIRDIFNRPDPLRAATYTAAVRNNYLGMQVGGEYGVPIPIDYFQSSIWILGLAKGSLGVNAIERTWTLTRGDGFRGFKTFRTTTVFASVNEVAAAVDLHIMERLRIRAGYTLIWAVGFASSDRQIDFNLSTQGQAGVRTTDITWHGPMAEVQFLF